MTNMQTLRDLREAGNVPEQDHRFVDSLIRADATKGLSLKQSQWVARLVERFTAPAPKPTALPSVAGVVALLAQAKARGLKFPKLWLNISTRDGGEHPLRITVAGEKSRTPGYLMLTDGEPFGSSRFYGRISPAGALEIGRDGPAVADALVALLTRLAKDPAGVAAEFGHLTGHCCFCSLALKDERSVAVGYGPVCAEKFGVPWGETPKAKPAKTGKRADAAVKAQRGLGKHKPVVFPLRLDQ